ncbi:nitroreductase family deazaflavin-dependent oxidoreductase [Subtercola sp. YIM 133946]|uniref:nitroreductase family deazaflavin-dependent oxidoreductase n=1 Tax=Subtercola sp. YIM 133946 TaxID=3118909 RepID=UPI002F94EA5F
MSDAAGTSPENPIDNDAEWVKKQIEEYLATDGEKPTFKGGAPLVLLTTQGRTSGEWRRTCLIGAEDEGRQILVASLGGAPKHPAWYLNLQANPEVVVQNKGAIIRGTARTATAEEKPALWAKMVSLYPDYADYQTKTDREIPVVIVDPIV